MADSTTLNDEATGEKDDSLATQLISLSVSETDRNASSVELPDEIKFQECFYTWTEGAIDTKLIEGLKTKQNEKESSPKGGMEIAISETESKVYELCHLLYNLIEVKNFDESDKTTTELNDLVAQIAEDKKTHVEAFAGYLYIINNLKGYLLWKKTEPEKLAAHLESLTITNFTQLSINGQITVLRIKLLAFQHFRLKNPIVVVEKLAELESDNPKWCYYKYFYYRDVRRKIALTAPPEEKEMNAISKALELEPDNFVYIVTGFQNLAERLRYFNPIELCENPISWTDKRFSTIEQVLEYLKAETKLLLKYSENVPGYCYTLLGEVFSSCLPRNLLDFVLAEKCIRRALDVSPNCTRVNHRMGIFLWKTARNFGSAVTYLQRASELSSQNFHSRADLIHLLLSKPDEQQEALTECFDKCLGEGYSWDAKELSELKFLKGCFLMMTNGSSTEAAKFWIDAFDINPSANHFAQVYYQSRRFLWNNKDFNFSRCKDVISYAMDKGALNSEELDTITKVSEGILKGIQTFEADGRNSNKNFRVKRSSESDESSWRSQSNRGENKGDDNRNYRSGERGRGQRGRGYNNSHSRPFQRNRSNSGAEEGNWRQ